MGDDELPAKYSISGETSGRETGMNLTKRLAVRNLLGSVALVSFFFGLASIIPAAADDYAYLDNSTGNGTDTDSFGVVDLTTGVYTECGKPSTGLNGLGVGPDHQLYGTGQGSTDDILYKIDVTNGTLTPVGQSGIHFGGVGSTKTGLYALAANNDLYSVNYQTAAATLVGPIGIDLPGFWGLSTNANGLLLESEHTLYKLDPSTGAARLRGDGSEGRFGAEAWERGTLYGVSDEVPFAIYSISREDGSVSKVSTLTGVPENLNPYGLAPIKDQVIQQKNICKVHEIL